MDASENKASSKAPSKASSRVDLNKGSKTDISPSSRTASKTKLSSRVGSRVTLVDPAADGSSGAALASSAKSLSKGALNDNAAEPPVSRQSRLKSQPNIAEEPSGDVSGTSRTPGSNNASNALVAATSAGSSAPGTAPEANANALYYSDEKLEGIFPMFLTGMTQDLFKVKIGEDVTTEKMFRIIPKSDLMSDIQARLAISDFYPAKALILQFPKEEMLLHYDPEYKYGQNFFLCVSPETMDAIINPIVKEEVSEQAGVSEKTERVRVWKTLGSDKEIEMERVRNTRELVTIKASRKRGEFKNMCKFGDRDAHDGFLECRPYRDANYDLIRMEVNMAVQAVPELVNTSAQTAWFRPINFACQYEPAIMPRDEQDYIIHSSSMSDFLQTVAVRFEQGLQQNTLTNIFRDDYTHLGEEEMTLEQGAHTVLQEYQSFTDLVHSKDRCISCIDWHPAQKGVLAISCTQRVSFEERVEHGFNVRSKQSLIIVWSFHDPIHPQLILEAPEDVHAFRFNPVDPNIVVGGCANGQIVLWDISEYQDKLKSARKTDGEGVGAGSDESKDRQVETPVLKYSVVSSIEASHRAAIMDIHWLPQNFELASNGEPLEHGDNGHKQLLTASLDGTIAFWDLRFKKDWRSLDLAWRPFLRVPLSALDNTYDYSLTKVSVRASLLEKTKNADTEGSQRDAPSSAGKEKEKAPPAQKPWTSKFYCATEEGDLIYSDWIAEKTTEEKASRVETAFSMHYGPMSDLQRSPFFPDILLSVGGWSFHIWKEKTTTGPLVSSAPAPAYLIAGHWSPTRPGVFYIGRADGVLEVWDLLDTSHAPSTTQNITSTAISNLQIHQYGGKSSTGQQFIAAGDDAGTLHILEIPRNLQKQSKNEKSVISAFFEREGRRLAYSNGRKQQRVRERAGFEAALLEATASAAKAAAAAAAPKPEATAAVAAEGQSAPAPATTAADDEEDKAEQEFLKLERAFLEAEGLIAAPI